MISAVALSPSLDITYVVAELHGIQRPLEVRHVGGGKALNAARAAARLGARARAVAVLGGGTGEAVRAGAEQDGVAVEAVDGGGPTRTCVSVSSRATGELTEIYEHAPPVAPAVLDDVLARAAALARGGAGWWLVSGGTPASLGADALARVVTALQAEGCRVAVDSHGPALRAALDASAPDLVKVNRAEAAELTGLPGDSPLESLLRAVRARTGRTVVVTDGTDGAGALDGAEVLHAHLPGHVGRFPVGSGDTFLGAFLVAADDGGLGDAMRAATAAAAANAQVPGAAMFEPDEVDRLAPRVALRALARG